MLHVLSLLAIGLMAAQTELPPLPTPEEARRLGLVKIKNLSKPHLKEAFRLEAEGRFAEAAALVERVDAVWWAGSVWKKRVADLKEKAGDFQGAIAAWRASAADFDASNLAYRADDAAEARAKIAALEPLAADPGKARIRLADAFRAEGVAAAKEGRHWSAAEAFLRADALVPSAWTKFDAAEAHDKHGDARLATALYRRFLAAVEAEKSAAALAPQVAAARERILILEKPVAP